MPTDVQSQVFSMYATEDARVPMAVSPAADITGYTLEGSISAYPGGPILVNLTAANGGITVVSAAAGTFTFNVLKSIVAAQAPTTMIPGQYYYWDTWRIDGGQRTRLQGGIFLYGKPVGTTD